MEKSRRCAESAVALPWKAVSMRQSPTQMIRAILTDSHFWIPSAVLLFGVVVLAYCAR